MSASRVAVGTPQNGFQKWESAEVDFHGFADLPAARGDCTLSPNFICLGHEWRLCFFPGGEENSDDGMVAVYLDHTSDERIEIEYFFSGWGRNRQTSVFS